MKYFFIMITFLSLSLFTDVEAQKIETIYGTWYRSYEEDKGEVITYRPKGYQFPPIRGREKVEFLSNGDILEWRISPTDAYAKVKGKFTYCEIHNELIFSFLEKGEEVDRKYKVTELSKSILKIQLIRE